MDDKLNIHSQSHKVLSGCQNGLEDSNLVTNDSGHFRLCSKSAASQWRLGTSGITTWVAVWFRRL